MRWVLLVLFLACATLGAAAAAPSDPTALLARSRAALGGDAIFRLRAVHIRSTLETIGIKGTQEQWEDLAGNTYAEAQDAGPASGADGWDGRESWVRDASGIVHVEGATAARIQAVDQAYLNGYALWAPDRGGAAVEAGEAKSERGVTYQTLRVTPKDGSPLEVWFDPRTALPWRVVAVIAQQTSTTELDDYRPVDGALYPYHSHTDSDTGNSSDARITSLDANPGDIAERVRKPESTARDFSIDGGATQTSVPFELVDNHVYVDVKLNGKGPYRFVFDSGAGNFVDAGVLKELGGATQGNAQGQGVGSQSEGFGLAKITTLQIAQARLSDQNFVVAPTRAGFGVGGGVPIDGLIGFDVLARFIVTNDYEHRRIVLRLPSAEGGNFGTAIPFVFHDNTPQISGSINGTPAAMTVDTGSRVSISVFKHFIDAHPSVAPATLTASGVDGFGVGGAAMGRLGRIAALQIGPYVIKDAIGDFSEQQKGAFADPYVAANVGGAVWKRFALTFDYGHQTLYLSPNSEFAQRESYDRSGMFLINRAGKLTVYGVRAGTPAALAGLAKGDVLSSVDGKTASSLTLADVRTLLGAPAGTRVRLQIVRPSGARLVELTLRDYV